MLGGRRRSVWSAYVGGWPGLNLSSRSECCLTWPTLDAAAGVAVGGGRRSVWILPSQFFLPAAAAPGLDDNFSAAAVSWSRRRFHRVFLSSRCCGGWREAESRLTWPSLWILLGLSSRSSWSVVEPLWLLVLVAGVDSLSFFFSPRPLLLLEKSYRTVAMFGFLYQLLTLFL